MGLETGTAILLGSLLLGGAGAGAAAIAASGGEKESQESQVQAVSPPDTSVGNVTDVGSLEQQAAQRRLARMSKYFTTPTGVLDTPTGTSGVF